MKKLIAFISMLFFLGIFFLWPADPAWAQRKKYMFIGATSTSSSFYSLVVAYTKAINKHVSEVNASVVETGATVDNMKRLRAGQLDMAVTNSGPVVYEGWKGIGMWKDMPIPDLRALMINAKTIAYFVVRDDSGVKKLEDLEGKKFHLGLRGSGCEALTRDIFAILGIKPDYVIGGTNEAVSDMKDGRVVGLSITGAGTQLPVSVLDIMTLTKLRLIPMTPEHVQKVKKVASHIPFITVPAGKIKAMTSQPEYTNFAMMNVSITMKNFPDNLSYKIVKAIIKERDMIIAAFPAHAEVDVAKESPGMVGIPLHAGAYRAYKEMGVNIPERAVPPEAKR